MFTREKRDHWSQERFGEDNKIKGIFELNAKIFLNIFLIEMEFLLNRITVISLHNEIKTKRTLLRRRREEKLKRVYLFSDND